MPNRWTKVKLAYDFLSVNNGQQVTSREIANATDWEISTAKTYITKKWAGILEPLGKSKYLVKNLGNVTWEEFKKIHSQVIIPSTSPTPKTYDYEVALSFAGEDRKYVSQVAEILTSYGIPVFYDSYETHTLWGKDLYVHLDEVYRVRSKYCAIFISKYYAKKLWTNHERKSAQARAFEEREEYLLPIRLDDTDIPGIRKTTGYIDANKLTATQLANFIAKKLGRDTELLELLNILKNEGPEYTITQDGTDLVFYSSTEDHTVTLSIKMLIEAMNAGQLDYFLQSSIFIW